MESYVDLKPLPPHQWDVSLQHIIVDMQGSPLNVHQLLAHQPDLLRTWWNSRQYLVSGASLSKRQAELVILRVAVQMKCWYEWGAHVVRGLQAGLSKDEIMKVIDGPESNTWNQSDRLLLKVVDDLFVHRKIRSNTLSELTECFTAHQVLDLIALASMYQFLGHVLNTWPTEIESNIQNVLPASFTKDNFDLHSNTAPSEHQHRLEPVTKNMDVEEISHLRMQWLMSKNHQSIK
jgi:alkylhydroperoxidase family enzyme